MRTLRRIGCGLLAACAVQLVAFGQEPAPLGQVIDDYVREGLRSNLALRSESLEVERQLAALDQARARFLPTIAFEARYSRADGGRQIDFPVGTLLNPVYSTLNELLAAQGRGTPFAPIEDQTFDFLREREQDTRLTLRQPIYAPAIPAAVRAQRALLESAQFGRVALARRLKSATSRSPISTGCARRARWRSCRRASSSWRRTCASTNRCSATASSLRIRCCAPARSSSKSSSSSARHATRSLRRRAT